MQILVRNRLLNIEMNKLKNTIIVVAVAILLVMVAATLVESSKGTDYVGSHIYGSTWFVGLWGVLALTSLVYIIRRRLYVRWTTFMVHVSFLVILAGALTSWLTSESGVLHLRQGEDVNSFLLKSGERKSLGHTIKLKKFQVEYYPGTDAPMDYSSEIVADNQPISISMNHIGQWQGYRFTQSGYDSDMQGTTLGVYYDPWGIGVTYVGYGLLFLSLLLMLVSKHTRLRSYYRRALGPKTAKVLLVAALLALPSLMPRAWAQDKIQIDQHTADRFGKICVLYNSRICPINTVAIHFVTKLCGRSSWAGLSANQVFAGWVFDVPYWETVKMIEIKDKEAQRLLGLKDKWAAFTDFWDQYNEYKLKKPLDDAYRNGDKVMQKKLRDADEKFNVVRMLYGGEMLKMFPYTLKSGEVKWLAPGEKNNYAVLPHKEWYFVSKSMDYTAESIVVGDNTRANTLIQKIYDYQHLRGKAVIPSHAAIYAELVYNKINTQRWPVMCYLTLTLLLVIGATLKLSPKKAKLMKATALTVVGVMFLHALVLLILRWIVSGHLPMSNGYETMQFLAWAVLLLTIGLYRRFEVILQYGPLLAAFALLVAMITDSNPQITQLMPVLQSPLLSVHVMIIMFSYALFGLMALVGIEGLVLHHRNQAEQVETLAALSHVLLYFAVALLAIGCFIGAIWANVSWGRYWSWDSKETWALITMMIYAAPLHSDIKWMHKPVHFHLYMVLAFLSVLMTYFGVNYFLAGMHSYA